MMRLLALALLALASFAGVARAQVSAPLNVITFNVLAPQWAAPVWYPERMDASLLDREFRRARITAFLRQVRDRTDVFCLQEVAESEFPHLLAALGPAFEGLMARNARDYWSSWIVPGLPWEPNGPAIVVRTSRLADRRFHDHALSDSGNHGALLEARDALSGAPVRLWSIHLDSDSNANRRRELGAALALTPAYPGYRDVICGDINEDTVTGTAAGLFKRDGFIDALATLGNREATHPFSSSYNNSARWAIIDHILVRNATPVAGNVFDFGTWMIGEQVSRIEENFRQCGSDHFPVGATIRY
jgi:endonuclease/exonuclease/phosphatase family metal-dependent hydrolase